MSEELRLKRFPPKGGKRRAVPEGRVADGGGLLRLSSPIGEARFARPAAFPRKRGKGPSR
jgi:hypothetical protein